jgi:hypothetical protein
MNSNSQIDFHPDVEILNAFAEQALSENERGQILAHLTACSRCRQVIYLAQEAAPELELEMAAASRLEMDEAAAYGLVAMAAAPAMSAAARPNENRQAANRPGSWFKGWRIAWEPAAAVMVIVGIAVLIHVRHTQQISDSGTNMARGTRPNAPEQFTPEQFAPEHKGTATSSPSREARVDAGRAQSSISSVTAKAFTAEAISGMGRAGMVQASPNAPSAGAAAAPLAAPPVGTVALQMSNAARYGAGMPSAAQSQSNALSGFAPQPGAAASPSAPAAGGNSFNVTDAGLASPQLHGNAAGRAQTSQSVTVAAAGNFEVTTVHPTVRAAEIDADHTAMISRLPSGLSAVSIATAQHRILAIDMAGALFLSEDSGKHWEPVVQQWSGRAVAVRIQRDLKRNSSALMGSNAGIVEDKSKQLSTDAVAGTPAPAATFEIVTDNDSVWVSTEGKSWKAK